MVPTRARGTKEPHTLDLVITSENILEEIQHCSPIGNSDHSVLRISCKWAYSQNIEKVIKYCYNRGNYKAFNDFIVNCNSLQGLQRFNDLEGLWNHIKTSSSKVQINSFH